MESAMGNSMRPSLSEIETQLRLGPPKSVKQGDDLLRFQLLHEMYIPHDKEEIFPENNVESTSLDEGVKKSDDCELGWNGLNLSIGLHSSTTTSSNAVSFEEIAQSNGSSLSRAFFASQKTPKTGSKRVFSDRISTDTVVNPKRLSSTILGSEARDANNHLEPSTYEWTTFASRFCASSQTGEEKACDPPALDPPPPRRHSFLKPAIKDQGGKKIFPKKLSLLHKASPSGIEVQGTKAQPTDAATNDAVQRGPVGWPPVQSFRKNSLPPPKPKNNVEIDVEPAVLTSPKMHSSQTDSLYVKVYMDGLSIGRKVDLKSYASYEDLLWALNELFSRFSDGQACAKGSCVVDFEVMVKPLTKLFAGNSDYVLTYEDKDGDLMLVGDVPWGMFTASAKRLRIMKGSEVIGLRKSLAII